MKKPFILNFSFVVVLMTSFEVNTYGQIPQGLLHGFVPKICLLVLPWVGNFAWHNLFFKFGGCLYAIIGGAGNISFVFGSLIIDLQCFLITLAMLGSFG